MSLKQLSDDPAAMCSGKEMVVEKGKMHRRLYLTVITKCGNVIYNHVIYIHNLTLNLLQV